jgi:hypothetical protein
VKYETVPRIRFGYCQKVGMYFFVPVARVAVAQGICNRLAG